MRIRTSDLGDDPWGIFPLAHARDETKNLFLYFLNLINKPGFTTN